MKANKPTEQPKKEAVKNAGSLFDRENMLWMLIGAAVMIIGFFLLAGGKSDDPKVFNPDEVYSTRRITIAPIVILIGLAIEVYAIFRNPRK